MEEVVFERTGSDLDETVQRLLSGTALRIPTSPSSRVVVKPNLGNPFHVDGVTTHPEVIVSVVAWLRNRFSDVAVVESNGIRYSCNASFESMGLTKTIPRIGGRLVNLSEDAQTDVPFIERGDLKIQLPRTLQEADIIVSLPVIKSHELTVISCAIKNLFGCVPSSTRIRLHPFLNSVLAELYNRLNPGIVVGDGLDAMEANGPIHGDVKHLSLLTSATDCLSHDAAIAEALFRTPWRKIDHLRLAAQVVGASPGEPRIVNRYGAMPNLATPQLDLVARTMAMTYRSTELTSLLYLTPLFPVLNRLAWSYRGLFGRKPKFDLHY